MKLEDAILLWYDEVHNFLAKLPFDIEVLNEEKEKEVPLIKVFNQVNQISRENCTFVIIACGPLILERIKNHNIQDFIEKYILESHKPEAKRLLSNFMKILKCIK